MTTGDLQWTGNLLWDKLQRIKRHPDYLKYCGNIQFDENGFNFEISDESDDIINRFELETLFDPAKEFDPNKIDILLRIFKEPLAVSYVWNKESPDFTTPVWDNHYIQLKIDISPKRNLGQIIDEVKEFISEAQPHIESELKTEINHQGKPPKPQRKHFEKRLMCYEIWDMRKKRTPFSKIAQQLHIHEDTARKSFYSSYELIMGKPFAVEKIKQLSVLKKELKRTCGTCVDRECLASLKSEEGWVPCPDVAHFINQDRVSQKEYFQADPHLLYSD